METTFKFSNFKFESDDPNLTITSVISTQSTQSAIDATDDLPIVRSSRPTEPKSYTRPLSTFSAIFLTVNTALGAGLFNLPYVFYRSGGFTLATAIQLVILLFIVGSLLLLSYCTDKFAAQSYHSLIEKALGKRWANISTIILVVYSYGCCLTFLLLIQDQYKTAFESYFGPDFSSTWYLHPVLATSVSAFFLILPFCFAKSLDLLKYPSSCGVLIIAYIIVLVLVKYLQTKTPFPVDVSNPKWTDMFTCVPAICFSYQCHLNWVPTHAEMRCRTNSAKTFITVFVSCAVCAFAYTFVSYAGIATFGGPQLSVDLIRNYDAKDPLIAAGIICFAFKTLVTYPIVWFCAREALVDQLHHWPAIWPKECVWRPRFLTLIWTISALIISVAIPDIGSVISLLGTVSVLFMFVLPGMCLLRVIPYQQQTDPQYLKTNKLYLLRLIASLYILLGILIFILASVQSIDMFLNPIAHPH